ncbi:DgyrCDS8954 [Dimorphilus gyrociliatus]|uniref:Bis(5'-nucleosyl)-tetraphosphatase [asymmetrical] n=1 Tax=Dimorphilus gyrociliatus TaxID=2664684 RepID=A0A7I8VVY9_9ANNE|nr:DgyrCDS8954 [Dimorphilus gyrociliatus]
MESRPLVAAGFIIYRIIQNTRQYLLLQTSYGKHHWTPPKGHVDPGESEMQTAIRETEEETGLKEEDYNLVEGLKRELHYEVNGRSKRVVYWIAQIKEGKEIKLSDEHIDYKWLNIKDAETFANYSDMIDALRFVDEFLSK